MTGLIERPSIRSALISPTARAAADRRHSHRQGRASSRARHDAGKTSPRRGPPSRPKGRCRRPAPRVTMPGQAPAPRPIGAGCCRRCRACRTPATVGGKGEEEQDRRQQHRRARERRGGWRARARRGRRGRSARRRAHAAAAPWMSRLSALLVRSPAAASRRRCAVADDQDAVGERQHFGEIGRDDDDRLAGRAPAVEPAVDVGAGRDIDAARRLDQDEDRPRRRDASAPASPSADCRRRGCGSAPRARPRRRRTRPLPRRQPPFSAACRPGRAGRAGAPARRPRCCRASGRLGRMPSCLRSSVSRQIPAAAASCGAAKLTGRPLRITRARARREGRRRAVRAISFWPAPSRPVSATISPRRDAEATPRTRLCQAKAARAQDATRPARAPAAT